jgi:hypothetical protein
MSVVDLTFGKKNSTTEINSDSKKDLELIQ